MVHVLLVEDDPAIAGIYALKLRIDGFAVSVADDHEAADRCFWQERPTVVCLDEWLPDGSGADLADRFAAAAAPSSIRGVRPAAPNVAAISSISAIQRYAFGTMRGRPASADRRNAGWLSASSARSAAVTPSVSAVTIDSVSSAAWPFVSAA